jgi:catechol 2,3-dioxygenase-like lactoylglutathione lyase family enzyme
MGVIVKIAGLLLALAFAAPLRTSFAQQASETPFTTTGAFLALSVADASASARWYREKFGMRVVLEPPPSNEATVIVLEGGGLIVELLQHKDAKSLSATAPAVRENYKVHGFFKSGLIVEDFDRTVAAMRTRGVEIAFGPFPRSATQRANVIVRDNAGNLIQFFGK